MIRINLLKPEKKEVGETPLAPEPEIKEKKKNQLPALVFLVLILGIAALFITQRRTLSKEKSLLNDAREQKKSLQNVVSALDQLEQRKTLLTRKINLIQQLQNRKGIAVTVVEALPNCMPEWVWFTEMAFNVQTVRIKGRALSNGLVAEFISNLQNHPSFSSVDLHSSIQRKVKSSQYHEFSLTARVFIPPQEPVLPEESKKGEKR